MIPESYWKREDTPMKNSPTGKAMLRIHELYPELTVHQCLERAREALAQAAGHKTYRINILTPAQAARWAKVNEERAKERKINADHALETAKSGHSRRALGVQPKETKDGQADRNDVGTSVRHTERHGGSTERRFGP